MLDRVLKTISRYNMLPQGSRVIAAVSGGADSVCLLHVLKELAPEALAGVAHFNHKWRADASDEDEEFVMDLACGFGLPFFRAEASGVEESGNREQNAREARLDFFRSLPHAVALGHTRDDQAETVLFRVLRGSGLAGLSGIDPARGNRIRPLIEVTRAEIEVFLEARGIGWREDSTNRDPGFARNRIRHHLMPQLAAEWNPRIKASLAHLADLAHEEESYWTQEIDRLAATHLTVNPSGEVEMAVFSLQALPRAVARRLLRRAVFLAKGDLLRIDFEHIEAIFDLKRRIRLPGVTVTRSFDWLQFARPVPAGEPEAIAVDLPGSYASPDGRSQICLELTQPCAPSLEPPPKACATLSMEACKVSPLQLPPLKLRGWRPGDHYRPQGQSRDQKVKEMFQKARVPCWRRSSWPILTSGEKILWSRQFGAAAEFAETGNGQAVLRIREVSLS